ncbi:MAG: NUDIX hydrolase [Halobacteriales archaeon]|nr:NUDIX hydrolase [Halobacteriales archaeon]
MVEDSLEWETLGSTTPYSCEGFDVQRDEVRLPDGHETVYDYLVEDPSVVILPFTPDDQVVVIDEWRQAVSGVRRAFPAGGVEAADDDLAAAAHRELEEETGYVADAVRPLTVVEPSNGIANAVHHYFVATDCVQNGHQRLDHDESIRVSTTDLDRLREQVLDGTIRDGRTVLGLLYYDWRG